MPPHMLAAAAAIALPILIALSYACACCTRPFRECSRCRGAGRVAHLIGRGWRFCPRCNGSGLRLRIGRRLWNQARDLHRDGTR